MPPLKLNPNRKKPVQGYVPGESPNSHASKVAQSQKHLTNTTDGKTEYTARVMSVSVGQSPWWSKFLGPTTSAYTAKLNIPDLHPEQLDPSDLPPGIKNVGGLIHSLPGEFSGFGDPPSVGDHVIAVLYDKNNPGTGGRVVQVIKNGVSGVETGGSLGGSGPARTAKQAFKNPCGDVKAKPKVKTWTAEKVSSATSGIGEVVSTLTDFWGITSAAPKKTPSSYTDSRPRTTTVGTAATPTPAAQVPSPTPETPSPIPSLNIPGCGPKYTIAKSGKRSMTDKELCRAARIPCRVLAAIRHVESRGRADVLRFEPHKWHRRLPNMRDQIPYTRNPAKGFSTTASETNKLAFARAFELNPSIAIKCTSFGKYQVMGWALLDAYGGDAQTAWDGFRGNPDEASDKMLAAWMIANPRARRAANESPPNFSALAKIYNGPNYAVNQYDRKMLNYWQAHP